MTDKKQTDAQAAAEFNLKHRVTGAAVLLFFGALVIPWLLGPPSGANDDRNSTQGAGVARAATADGVDTELLDDLNPDAEEPEETVYISRITPLDAADQSSPAAENNSAVSDQAASEAEKTVSDQQAEKAAADAERKSRAEAEAKRRAADKAAADKLAQQQREQALQAKLQAESDNARSAPKVDVGWVVQVGLYLEKNGAQTKMAELRDQGFTPSSTVVDTNRGPKTGTRVWIGPFEKRTAAESENKKLKQRTGKDGFIRVYP